MAGSTSNKKKTDYPARTFVKTDKDGTKLTRTVTTPATEVAAKFDGFLEEAGGGKTSGGNTGGGGSSTGKQVSSAS
jgi:hypothetical protein